MFDWYVLITPIVGCLVLLGLISLKLSLKDEADPNYYNHTKLQKIKTRQNKPSQNSSPQQQQQQSVWQTSQYLKTYSYLIRNHSFLEMCITKTSKNKLPILLSWMIIGCLSLFFVYAYYLCVVGLPLVIIFVCTQSMFERQSLQDVMEGQDQFMAIREQVKQQNYQQSKKKYVYIAYTTAICGLGLFIGATIYKNYINTYLSTYALTFLINSVLDWIVVRPIGFIVLSIPLKFNDRIQNFIHNQNIRITLSNLTTKIEIQLKQCATNMSPRKKQINSPTKVPKAIQRLNKKNSQSQTLINAMDVIKRIKKQKNQSGLMTPLGRNKVASDNEGALQQYSLNQLFYQQDKSLIQNNLQNTPIAHFNHQQDSSCNQSRVKGGKRRNSELIIVQFKNNSQEQQQQQQADRQNQIYRQNPLHFIHSNLDEHDISQIVDTANKIEADEDVDNMRIIKLLEPTHNRSLQCSDDQQSNYTRNSKTSDNFLTIQPKVSHNLMCINQQGQQQRQIQQIDLNSPSKRVPKLQHLMQLQQQECKKRKSKCLKNNNAKRRVIKFTSGEPYLQYLPNMLNKQTNKHTKRSQPINFKSQFSMQNDEARQPRKSLRKIRKQSKLDSDFTINNHNRNNDQNQCPDAMYVEDL